jgi:protein tyrosine phosphatase (PTP) superfamily phosphohydrolase (DUF442 family)
MRLSSLILLARLTVVVGLIAGPVLYASHHQKQMRNFRVVRENVLYRSGQLSPEGIKRAVHEYGIRTVVSLRDARVAGETPPGLAEEAYCRSLDITFVRLTPLNWAAPDGGPAPVQPNVDAFLKLMKDPANYPVLVHCFAGVHRTGAYCAIYRMENEGWTNEQAMDEMKAMGYENLPEETDIFGYLSKYRPRSR